MENFNQFLRVKNSLSMETEDWERIKRSPGWMRDGVIALEHFKDADGTLEVVEFVVAETVADGVTTDEYQLSMLVGCDEGRPAEIDFGAGSFVRPSRVGEFLFCDNRAVHRGRGIGPFHSISMSIDRARLQRHFEEFSEGKVQSLEPLLSSSFRDDVLSAMVKGLLNAYRLKANLGGELDSEERLRKIARRLLLLSGRDVREVGDDERLCQPAMKRVVEYLHAHLACEMSVDGLAKIAGVSAGHFRRLFSQTMGVTPKKYLMDLRIEMAKRLLLEESEATPIAEIAARCGFASRSHLYLEFRRALGISPHEFRAMQ